MKNAKALCVIGVMTAAFCLLAPAALPIGPVPVTLATFMIHLLTAVLPRRQALPIIALYLLIGAIGVPVFAGYTGGMARLIGPTGGFLIGYLPGALAQSLIGQKSRRMPVQAAGMAVGAAVWYLLGCGWFALQTGTGLLAAAAVCVVPFLPGDAAKIAVVLVMAPPIRRTVEKIMNS